MHQLHMAGDFLNICLPPDAHASVQDMHALMRGTTEDPAAAAVLPSSHRHQE